MWRGIATVGNFPNPVKNIDAIKLSSERVRSEPHYASRIGGEVADTHQVIAGIECEIANPSSSEINVKVGVVIVGRKIATRIPGSANRTVSSKLRSGNGGPIGPEIDHVGIIAIEDSHASGSGEMLPVQNRAGMDEVG